MKKILTASSVALFTLLVTPSVTAVELDIKPSGFVDMVWTLSDGTDLGINGEEGRFNTSGELDIESQFDKGVSMRFDADINPSTGGSDSARLEQIFLQWDIDETMSLKGGVFNNKLTFEREDAPDIYSITHGQLWDIWNFSTAEDGNNLQGVEFNVHLDTINLIVGYLNDLGDIEEKNSLEIAGEISATENLDITLGIITQDEFLETIFDIFAVYKTDKLLLAGELLIADEGIDNGIMLMANIKLLEKLSATIRFDRVEYDSAIIDDDTSSLTLAGLYSISENLTANAEIRLNDDDNNAVNPSFVVGEGDGTTARLELIASF
jgi:hypothetical protein